MVVEVVQKLSKTIELPGASVGQNYWVAGGGLGLAVSAIAQLWIVQAKAVKRMVLQAMGGAIFVKAMKN
mgnify:CR=1 FL=1